MVFGGHKVVTNKKLVGPIAYQFMHCKGPRT